MQLDKVQHKAKAHIMGSFGLLSRLLVVGFAVTMSPALTATMLAQQPAGGVGQTEGAVKALAAATTKTQKETGLDQPSTATDTAAAAIRPFRVNVPQEVLDSLRRRLAATRLPDQETVNDQSQGVQLATMKELVSYWQTDYDWRKAEAKLNALPQFVTTIDGVDIHFIHVRSKSPLEKSQRREPTVTSSTSTRSIGAGISLRGSSRDFSQPRCARGSNPFASS